MNLLDEFEHDPRLREVARAIASGTPVDWDALVSSAGDGSYRELLERLRTIALIADAHTGLEVAVEAVDTAMPGTARTGSPVVEPAAAAPRPLARWGPLVLHERIGEGSFGEVFRAWDPRLDREVALKLLRPGRHEDAEAVGRAVIAEGRALARVRHPNVVTVYGADRIDGQVGVWMEYVHGRTLEEVLRERGPCSIHEAVGIGLDVCRALAAVHHAGLLHRDVKAQNVMREEGGRTVLTDFGTAAQTPGVAGAEPVPVAGTPLYLAPEVLAGDPPSVRSDVYSAGVLLFHLVTRSFPVGGRTLDEIRDAHRAGLRTLLRSLRPDLPDRFVAVIEQAILPDAAARPQSAAAFERGLVEALTVGSPEVAGRPRARRKRKVSPFLAAAAGVAVVAGAAYVFDAAGLRSRLAATAPAGSSAAAGRLLARNDSGEIVIRRVPIHDGAGVGHPDPGGKYLPYVTARADLAIFDVATGASRTLVKRGEGNEWPQGSAPSRDGTRVALAWSALDGVYELRTVVVEDGWVEVVARFPEAADLTVHEWAAGDRSVLASVREKVGPTRLVLVDVEAKSADTLFTLEAPPTGASLSPDGRLLVFDRPVGEPSAPRDVVLRDLTSDAEVPLAASDAFDVYPQWLHTGEAVFFLSDRTGTPSVWVQRVTGGRPDGPPELAGRHLGPANSIGLTRTGAYYFMLHASMVDVYTAQLDAPGAAREVPAPVAGQNQVPTWSPDGRALAWIAESGFLRAHPGSRTVVVRESDTGETRTLRPRLGFFTALRWSPDGTRLLVVGYDERGLHGIFTIDAPSGAVSPIVLDPPGDETGTSCPQWQDGGRGIYFSRQKALRARDLASGAERVVFTLAGEGLVGLDAALAGACVQEAPDGAALAFSGTAIGKEPVPVVKVKPAAGASREVWRGAIGESLLLQGWMPDGAGLLVVRRQRGVPRAELFRVPVAGGTPEPTGIALEGLRNVTVNPRTGELAFTAGLDRWEPWVMENFLRPRPGG
jgi:serine/threonine-protein kinase